MSEKVTEDQMPTGAISPYPAYGSMQLTLSGQNFQEEKGIQENKKMKDELTKANAERRQLISLVEQLAQRYQDNEKTVEQLAQKYQDSEKTVKQLQTEVNNARKVTEDLHTNIQVYGADFNDLEKQNKHLTLEFAKKDSELTAQVSENQRLSEASRQIQTRMNNTLKENQQLRQQMKELEEKYAETKLRLESYGFAHSEVSKDYRTMEEKFGKLQREKSQLEERYHALMQVNDEMNSEHFHSLGDGGHVSSPMYYSPPPPAARRQEYASLPAVSKIPQSQAAKTPLAGSPSGRAGAQYECPICQKMYQRDTYEAFTQHVNAHFFE